MLLYKYLLPERTDVLRGAMLRFTQPNRFNDPFEMLPYVVSIVEKRALDILIAQFGEILTNFSALSRYPDAETWVQNESRRRNCTPTELLNTIRQQPELTSAIMAIFRGGLSLDMFDKRKFVVELQRKFGATFGILCLAEDPANLLMWAHYTSSHTGFVIGFDAEDEFFDQRSNESQTIHKVRKVRYSNTRPVANILNPLKGASANVKQFANDFVFTKGVEWDYEKEWRMILPLDEKDLWLDQEDIYLFSFPPRIVKTVILGCRILDDTKDEIEALINQDDRYAHVKLQRASIDEKEFRLNIGP